MKIFKPMLVSLPLVMGGCTDSTPDRPAEQSPLKEQTRVWTQETKKLGETAWQSAREAANSAAEKSKDYYESAKGTASEAYDSTKEAGMSAYRSAGEATGDAYDATKEATMEAYDAAREKSIELYEATRKQVDGINDSPAGPATGPGADTTGEPPRTDALPKTGD